jgi:hypothetical protein
MSSPKASGRGSPRQPITAKKVPHTSARAKVGVGRPGSPLFLDSPGSHVGILFGSATNLVRDDALRHPQHRQSGHPHYWRRWCAIKSGPCSAELACRCCATASRTSSSYQRTNAGLHYRNMDDLSRTYLAQPCMQEWRRRPGSGMVYASAARHAWALGCMPDNNCRASRAFMGADSSVTQDILVNLGILRPPRQWWDTIAHPVMEIARSNPE